jgi:hypothetical protein
LRWQKSVSVFADARIDLAMPPDLEKDDLKARGLPLGPRHKILAAQAIRRSGVRARRSINDSVRKTWSVVGPPLSTRVGEIHDLAARRQAVRSPTSLSCPTTPCGGWAAPTRRAPSARTICRASTRRSRRSSRWARPRVKAAPPCVNQEL